MIRASSFIDAIGNTPLIRLNYFSERTGCEIYGKAEFMNPGGSVKDRAAKYIILKAEERGELRPGGTIVEGTAGNTGIGLVHIGNSRGYKTIIVIPETQSREKMDLLRTLGAEVRPVPAVPYRDENNYVKVAGRLAKEIPGGFWANQFDNTDNRLAHYETTGPEIWQQCEGKITHFTCALGTGGTFAGVGFFLKERNPEIRCVAADPMGSAIYSYVKTGELKTEGNSISEGIGTSRITKNAEGAPFDDALQIPDQEALEVLHILLKKEGLFLGLSSAINVAAAYRLAQSEGPGKFIVTVLCDTGIKYMSKLFNKEFLESKGLRIPEIH
ncbi:MAG: cysteine synthase A [Leptospiraceae bacterium]|nr:cysteine synthase A [Leptospiraceae bacterium]MDW8306525.1 cysteine synthase A [Leptospiraceae bacterium]